MKKRFIVEIETESEENTTTSETIHLALVKHFVGGVYIRVKDQDACPFCQGKGKFSEEYDGIRCHWRDGTGIRNKK